MVSEAVHAALDAWHGTEVREYFSEAQIATITDHLERLPITKESNSPR
jgi:hypothetical protein